ncbi:MAG: DbpA RNA binding domain-containing protein, partial [Myxococcales bacterium]|nr:DbpA RNA binding domain-containing protein [Myxococcales bacterium]
DDGDRRGRSTASGAERPRRDTRRGETRPDAEKPGGEKRNGTPRESTAAKPERPSSETNGAETNVTLRTPTTDIAGDPEAVREIRVNVGRKDGARPSDFRRTLMDRGSLSDADTEHVNVRPEHTFVGVKTRVLDRAMHALNGATIAGKEAKAELTPSG